MAIGNNPDIAIRFATDQDMLDKESFIDEGNGLGFWPRTDADGNTIRSWERYHQSAMNELDRRFRSTWSTSEPFELGLLDPRAQGRLRDAAVYLALHFLFVDINREGSEFYTSKANWYWARASDVIDTESKKLDYDSNRDGTTDESEKNQPFVGRVIRG
jgi:hypothetical protein